jgi:hypothetical protein
VTVNDLSVDRYITYQNFHEIVLKCIDERLDINAINGYGTVKERLFQGHGRVYKTKDKFKLGSPFLSDFFSVPYWTATYSISFQINPHHLNTFKTQFSVNLSSKMHFFII